MWLYVKPGKYLSILTRKIIDFLSYLWYNTFYLAPERAIGVISLVHFMERGYDIFCRSIRITSGGRVRLVGAANHHCYRIDRPLRLPAVHRHDAAGMGGFVHPLDGSCPRPHQEPAHLDPDPRSRGPDAPRGRRGFLIFNVDLARG